MITAEFKNPDSAVAKAIRARIEAVRSNLLKYFEEFNPLTTYNNFAESEADIDDEKFTIRISNTVLLPIHDAIKVC